MTQRMKNTVRRFVKSDSGSVNTISFAIWLPFFTMIFLTAIEVGMFTARSTMLEKGLDLAVRTVRIQGSPGSDEVAHEQVKQWVCDYARILGDCENKLRLEMVVRDMRDWRSLNRQADCTDSSEDTPRPVRRFRGGAPHQMMIIRACLKVRPLFAGAWFSRAVEKDQAGEYAIVTKSAFVQEPG